ncbi:MAG: hypothetical protein GX207_03300, partial [Peptococcaceae bacterium]|nr:hypothetical protein [Peptococcaceae bacterium]
NLKKAISAVENSLAKALPVAIGFLANLAGIGGIAEKIKDVIKKLRQPIDKAVEKVVNFVADKARALMGTDNKEKPAVETAKDKGTGVVEWWKIRKIFKAKDGKEHSIFFEGKDENAQLMIASQKMQYTQFISGLKPKDEAYKKLKRDALAIGKEIDMEKIKVSILHKQYQDPQKDKDKKLEADKIQKLIKDKVNELSLKLIPLMDTEIPEKRYLPKNFDVRRLLYIKGSGFNTLSRKLRNDKAKEINKELDKIRKMENLANKKYYLDQVRKGKLIPPNIDDEIILKNGISPSELHVDHIDPLAKHWVNIGHDSSDEERNYEASKESNLKVIHGKYNLAKGSKDEWGVRYFYNQKPYVGRNFSSMNNDSPLGAMKINGRDFILP